MLEAPYDADQARRCTWFIHRPDLVTGRARSLVHQARANHDYSAGTKQCHCGLFPKAHRPACTGGQPRDGKPRLTKTALARRQRGLGTD